MVFVCRLWLHYRPKKLDVSCTDERRYSFGAVGSFAWHIWMHVLLAVSVILMVSL